VRDRYRMPHAQKRSAAVFCVIDAVAQIIESSFQQRPADLDSPRKV
jgi:hypothetical protein